MIQTHPVTLERWDDFAALCRSMGPNRSCWCMWWRDDPASPARGPKSPARARARELVARSDHPVGVLAYDRGAPVGWAAVSPRAEYPRVNRRRDAAPVGGTDGVWIAPCFFVLPDRRGTGVARALLGAAVRTAVSAGARAVEGIPGDPATKSRTPTASYTGTLPMFVAAGFHESARRTPKGLVVVRLDVGGTVPTARGTVPGTGVRDSEPRGGVSA